MARVVIDPGHGGWQTIPGDSTWNNAVGPNGTLEKNLTLDIGRQVFSRLQGAGHEVKLTRDADVNLRLRDRAKVAKSMNAHAFVSIHFNGSTPHNAQGTETLVHLNYSPMSAALSLEVQDAVLSATKLTDRNKAYHPSRIKPQALGVLRPAWHAFGTAACLVEVSFLDRADEEARLQSAAYRAEIAASITQGIENYVSKFIAAPVAAMTDVGDAIEAEAVSKTGKADAVAYLDLNSAAPPKASSPAKGTSDQKEDTGKVAKPFSAAFVEGSGAAMTLIGGPPNWPDLQDFVSFIEGLNLEHFEPDEFLFLGGSNQSGKCEGKNSFPPRDLWSNIANTAVMLDAIRSQLGAPIRILSCYRSPAYNACVKGEDNSLHMEFNAIDFTCAAGTPEIWRRVADELRSSDKKFAGGIGIYPRKNFLHIDTRGKAANWKGT